ncbi:holo-ACP synthase [Aeromonas veronii]|uniref:holo-ACP synthase n=1 Tax=Aeromonas veronii TaxID=654 RepID=UPI0031FC8E68
MIRIGTDIVEVAKISSAIKDLGSDFIERVYTVSEIRKIDLSEPNYERASGFWAAKEAAVKAIGYGYRDGIKFQDIEIVHDDYGCPSLIFDGRMRDILTEHGIVSSSLSISHCSAYAMATVIYY